ncbi:NAD(P)/FAD-dependent oxidoreductase [Rhodococcus sp. NPDC058532]|uniref:NAD(P)/FAD-dependent oxidoreductase n=1 Tax=Rhodococcus sp. NPDC058532 TaxID=3346540 RepID=UPI0036469506
MNDSYDVVIVGGGAAGLGGALSLTRARRSVLVVDSGAPRNASAEHMHNYLGREGTNPLDLLRIGRGEIAGYGGEFISGAVVDVRRAGGVFRVVLADGGEVAARQVLVTSGLVDELPDVPGLRDRWGRDVLHCPYCHGWEVRDRAIGILATHPALAAHQAQMWRQWSADVVVFAHTAPAFAGADLDRLAARGIEVIDGAVAGLEVADDRLTAVLVDGRGPVARDAVVVPPRFTARVDFLASLGIKPVAQEMAGEVLGTHLAVDPTGATPVAGVWAAGNVIDPRAQVISAAASGVQTGAMINAALIEQDVEAALDRSRVG